jgi:hypothetical protein
MKRRDALEAIKIADWLTSSSPQDQERAAKALQVKGLSTTDVLLNVSQQKMKGLQNSHHYSALSHAPLNPLLFVFLAKFYDVLPILLVAVPSIALWLWLCNRYIKRCLDKEQVTPIALALAQRDEPLAVVPLFYSYCSSRYKTEEQQETTARELVRLLPAYFEKFGPTLPLKTEHRLTDFANRLYPKGWWCKKPRDFSAAQTDLLITIVQYMAVSQKPEHFKNIKRIAAYPARTENQQLVHSIALMFLGEEETVLLSQTEVPFPLLTAPAATEPQMIVGRRA